MILKKVPLRKEKDRRNDFFFHILFIINNAKIKIS